MTAAVSLGLILVLIAAAAIAVFLLGRREPPPFYVHSVPPELFGPGRKPPPAGRRTVVSIFKDMFRINGVPTLRGRNWRGRGIEGLLPNARLVQGIFDDLNPETRGKWAYPDTGGWDPERNTAEFVAAMPDWRRMGLLAFTINLQGGMPRAGADDQPWENSALAPDGELRPGYMARLARMLDRADELGMAVFLGIYYFGQDRRMRGERAVKRGLDNAVRWTLAGGWRNVLVEVNNECDVRYTHAVLKPEAVHELIQQVQGTTREGRALPAGTSYGGGSVPGEKVVQCSDFILIHGNGVGDPDRIAALVRDVRAVRGYAGQPVVFNEDDHYGFDLPRNNMAAAVEEYASWGYYDQGEGNYRDGFQSPPVNWKPDSSPRKRAFFGAVREMTGGAA